MLPRTRSLGKPSRANADGDKDVGGDELLALKSHPLLLASDLDCERAVRGKVLPLAMSALEMLVRASRMAYTRVVENGSPVRLVLQHRWKELH